MLKVISGTTSEFIESIVSYPLSHYLYGDIKELQDKATHWLWTYNHERPNMGLGGITPMQKLNQKQLQNSTVNFH